MKTTMMDVPLSLNHLLDRAGRYFAASQIVSRRPDKSLVRHNYAQWYRRTRALGAALAALGLKKGDRVATLSWNHHAHLECYFGIPAAGGVMHTLNLRLAPAEIGAIAADALDRFLVVDDILLPLYRQFAGLHHFERVIVFPVSGAPVPAEFIDYEALLASVAGADEAAFTYAPHDENDPVSMCYTSGTTGRAKGVAYSHRSTILHSLVGNQPDYWCMKNTDVLMPVAPMFHANAWGMPFSAPLVGAKLVFPGCALDGKSLHELFEQEKVTFSAGVPTVWNGLIQYMRENKVRLSTLKRTVIGGAACPPAMIRALEDEFGIEVNHAWGLTEMSPRGSVCKLQEKHLSMPAEQQRKLREKQGHVVFGVDWKIVDGNGDELPWDGEAFGDLLVRGPWVIRDYYKSTKSPLVDGWFPTGDVATIDPDGYLQITDRSKDVIKSGGEWISSIDLENLATAHPAVLEAAVIACRHPKWDERPLLIVVKKPGAELTREQLLAFYEGKVAKWWVPDDVVFVDELPHTATGKLMKTTLRERFASHPLPSAKAGSPVLES